MLTIVSRSVTFSTSQSIRFCSTVFWTAEKSSLHFLHPLPRIWIFMIFCLSNKEFMENVKEAACEDDPCGTNADKESKQPGFDRFAEHDQRGQAQGGNCHHECQDRSRQCPFAQQGFRHGDRTENIRIHGRSDCKPWYLPSIRLLRSGGK